MTDAPSTEGLEPEREPIARLRTALEIMLRWTSYETEYDGRTYEICHSCSGQDGDHRPGCQLPAFRDVLGEADQIIAARTAKLDALTIDHLAKAAYIGWYSDDPPKSPDRDEAWGALPPYIQGNWRRSVRAVLRAQGASHDRD